MDLLFIFFRAVVQSSGQRLAALGIFEDLSVQARRKTEHLTAYQKFKAARQILLISSKKIIRIFSDFSNQSCVRVSFKEITSYF